MQSFWLSSKRGRGEDGNDDDADDDDADDDDGVFGVCVVVCQ